MFQFLSFFVILALGDVTCEKLPSYISPCQRKINLNECVAANINAAKPHLKNGVEALGVPPLDPYFLPFVRMKGPTFIYEDRNLTLKALDEFVLKEVDLDMEAGLFKVVLDYAQVVGETIYSIEGTVFDMELSGGGLCVGELRDVRLSMTLKRSNNDKEYFDLEKFEMNLFGRQADFYFYDLVPGNPEETKAANAVLAPRMNEFMYMKEPLFEQLFGGLLVKVVNAFISKYSLDELFVD